MELPRDLREALNDELSGLPVRVLAETVERLSQRYRTVGAATAPILGSPVDVAAYAAYRMPATYAAVRAALAQVALAAPQLRPTSLVDLGGGTGAAAWAVREQFATVTEVRVVDQVAAALELGRRLAARSVLHRADWQQGRLAEVGDLTSIDLVTLSYVLSELSAADQVDLVERAAAAALVVVVEPGTPDGFQRVLSARATMLAAGLTIVAPCPHQGICPLADGSDWCHFGVRVNRSSLHRRLKSAELSYEDEKFSYVAGARAHRQPRTGRILRRPQQRKGLVSLRVCQPDGVAGPALVSQRQGGLYRSARDAAWGDPWPPVSALAGLEAPQGEPGGHHQ